MPSQINFNTLQYCSSTSCRYGYSEGMVSAECTGFCPAGYYCTEGTADPIPCPPGHFSNLAAYKCSLCPGLDLADADKVDLPCQNDRSCCYKVLQVKRDQDQEL